QQQRWLERPGLMTACEKVCVVFRVTNINAHRFIPAIGNRRKMGVEDCPQTCKKIGQGIGKVFVLAPSKTMSPHDDMAAEQLILPVEFGKSLTVVRRNETFEYCTALGVELVRDLPPIECLHALLSRQG